MSRVLKHIIFWILIYFVWTYMKSSSGVYFTEYLIVNLVNVTIYMMAYYLLRRYQLPRLYDQKRFLVFALSLITSSLLFYLIWRVAEIYWLDAVRSGRDGTYYSYSSFVGYLIQTVQFYSPGILLFALELYEERQQEKMRIERLEKEKVINELKFLKAQLNPHFLFNTLNNLYSYVLNQSPKAPAMILHLSGILDHVLYKSQHETVPLSEEVSTIQHFIALEKIRYGERLEVIIETPDQFTQQISPLLLLSVVENAFKHGASGDVENPIIQIKIEETTHSIQCIVRNTKSKFQGELNDAFKEGIGLSNIKRQLNLTYPNNHELLIDDQEDSFKVSIVINSKL